MIRWSAGTRGLVNASTRSATNAARLVIPATTAIRAKTAKPSPMPAGSASNGAWATRHAVSPHAATARPHAVTGAKLSRASMMDFWVGAPGTGPGGAVMGFVIPGIARRAG